MNRIRRHRWRIPLSLLAMVALVWAQLVLANHPACAFSAMASSSVHAQHGQAAQAQEVPPCHGTAVANDAPLCASHCSQGDLSGDGPRLLSVPTLGQVPLMPLVAVRRLPDGPDHADAAHPHGAWHRPTPHPASLLLI